MATRIDIKKAKHPKIELLDKKAEIERERKKLSRSLVLILIILIITLILEFLFLLMRWKVSYKSFSEQALLDILNIAIFWKQLAGFARYNKCNNKAVFHLLTIPTNALFSNFDIWQLIISEKISWKIAYLLLKQEVWLGDFSFFGNFLGCSGTTAS